MTHECLFCKIVNKNIKSEFIFESDKIIVIKDIHPQAKTHLLVVPKIHSKNILEINHTSILQEIFNTIQHLSTLTEQPEFRIQINTGQSEGQTIYHTHIHYLSNSKLKSG